MWASSVGFLKAVKSRTTFTFPFIEAVISGSVMIIIITITSVWVEFISYSFETYIYMLSGSISIFCGWLVYLFCIRKISLGIVFTIVSSVQIFVAIILDILIYQIIPNIVEFIGGSFIIVGIVVINIIPTISNKQNKSYFNSTFSLPFALTCLAGIIWSIGNFFNQAALVESSPISLGVIRSLTPIFVIGLIMIFRSGNQFTSVSKSDWRKIVPASFCLSIGLLAWFFSLTVNSVTINSIFMSSAPLFALIIGYVFFREIITKKELLGICLCLAGTLFVVISRIS